MYWYEDTGIFPAAPGYPLGAKETQDPLLGAIIDVAINAMPETDIPETVFLGDIGGATESDQQLFDNAVSGNPRRRPGELPAGHTFGNVTTSGDIGLLDKLSRLIKF